LVDGVEILVWGGSIGVLGLSSTVEPGTFFVEKLEERP
jgi:hypothetical protein